jgi:hypothetical protein
MKDGNDGYDAWMPKEEKRSKSEEINALKKELLQNYNIKTDRDLIKQLGIKEEDKAKLFAWIRYQCAFSYREGFDNGQDELRYSIRDILTPTR